MNTKLLTNIAKAFGISSTKTLAVVTVIYFVLTSTNADGRPVWLRMHDHTIQATATDRAIISQISASDDIRMHENFIKAHKERLQLIKDLYGNDGPELLIQIELWKLEANQLDRNLNYLKDIERERKQHLGILTRATV